MLIEEARNLSRSAMEGVTCIALAFVCAWEGAPAIRCSTCLLCQSSYVAHDPKMRIGSFTPRIDRRLCYFQTTHLYNYYFHNAMRLKMVV